MKISVIIPVYNEKSTLREILRRVEDTPFKKEIIIVDDSSTDGSREIIEELNESYRKIFHKNNLGKGACIKSALNLARGDIIVIQDADLEYAPSDYPKLIEPILQNKAEVVYGCRNRSISIFSIGAKLVTCLTNLLYKSSLRDVLTGYKSFRADIIKKMGLHAKGFDFCTEITSKLLKNGYNIYEVPIKYNPRRLREGKKIKIKDGFLCLYTLLKYRFFN